MAKIPSAAPQRAAPKRINRSVVLQAGLAVFSAKGFNGASMRDIANEAETSLSNLYNYFPSKTFLLAQLLLDTGTDLYNRLEAAVSEAEAAPAARLAAAVTSYIGFIVDRPQASIVGISEIRYLEGPSRAEVTVVRDRTEQLFRSILAEGSAAGEFSSHFPVDAARAIVTMCSAVSNWYRPDGPLGQAELAERYVEFSLGIAGAH
ncbi:TetR/AcrR family transcriptional regulator [Pseudarthrobacter sp. H2]|uniref:TetR/AcrR family transcriptional regulator n=1 Tax=Pseudarthrobacter sp. H2 TaxID=3418415 RepID=UPI003CFA221B